MVVVREERGGGADLGPTRAKRRPGAALSAAGRAGTSMVMTIAKITAGDGYTYLTRHTAHGDAEATGEHDATAYYTAQGNPPGVWTGRGAPLLGLAGREVTEAQMRALFGLGEHPDSEAITAAYLCEHVRAEMTGKQLERVRDEAIAAAS